MFCSNCGAENSATAGFCIQCGQALGSVAAGVVPAAPAAPVAPPPTPSPASTAPSLARLLGVSGPEIEWGAGAAFLAASILADLVFILALPRLRGPSATGLESLVLSSSGDLILTAAAVAAFRLVRNDAGAAALAAVGYTILHSVLRLTLFQFFLHTSQGPPVFILYSLIGNFLFLLILALAVRRIQPTWLGLWAGATVAQLVASLVYRVGYFVYSRLFGQSSYPLSFSPWDVVQVLLFATVFAFSFWGGLTLFAPRVLRD